MFNEAGLFKNKRRSREERESVVNVSIHAYTDSVCAPNAPIMFRKTKSAEKLVYSMSSQ